MLILGLISVSVLGGLAPSQDGEGVERHLAVMGSSLDLEVRAADRATALRASEAAVRALEATEARLSTWGPDSELAAVNRAPVGELHPLSPALRADLELAWEVSEATGGAFDPALAPLLRAWGVREGGKRPSEAALRVAWAASGRRHFALLATGIRRLDPRAGIDEGGFGKGRGLDAALAAARAAGARSAVLDLGGQIACFGPGPFRFRVADPRDRQRLLLAVEIPGGSLATSGNGERGGAFGHLLDPRSGRPAPDFGSVTVWAEEAGRADALSTALYVLGPDAALDWAENHPGVEVLVVEDHPGGPRWRASSGLRPRLRLLDPPPREAAHSSPQEPTVAERLERLETELEELREDRNASSENPISLGGYGEVKYHRVQGGQESTDLHRVVLYFGYRFDEDWSFHSEIEFEHDDQVEVEFAVLDYQPSAAFRFQVGNLLMPVGLINRNHEPTTFWSVDRPQTERSILPSTWHQNGIGVSGRAGGFHWEADLVDGMKASGMDLARSGLRGGRQGGGGSTAEDPTFSGRLDWEGSPGLLVGASFTRGNAAQGLARNFRTTIWDLHLQADQGPLRLRGVWAGARVNHAPLLPTPAASGRLAGWYAEAGWDLLAGDLHGRSLTPFLRYERTDLAAGDSGNSPVEGAMLGLAWQPLPQIVFKANWERLFPAGTNFDRFALGAGFAF